MPSADSLASNASARAYAARQAAAAQARQRATSSVNRVTSRAPAPRPSSSGPYGSADSIARNSTFNAASAAAESQAIRDANNRAAMDRYLGGEHMSADAEAMWANPEAESAAINAAIARMNAWNSRPSYDSGGGGDYGGGGGGGSAAPATMSTPIEATVVPPAQIQAPPAAVQPPAVIANAGAGASNTAGESFSSIGNPSTFGEYQRRRQSRGPRTGMSITPEMIKRAASQRLG
ncbi:MAG: hypothetical protein ABWY25_02695 [Paenisporosarcina sp.]